MACGGSCGSGGCASGGGCGTGGGCEGCGSGDAGTGGCPAMHVYDWLTDLGVGPSVAFDLVEVEFKGGRKGIYRNVRSLDLQTGDFVIVEADRGVDFGTVHMTGELVRLRLRSKGLDEDAEYGNVIRVAGLPDIERWEAGKEEEAETFLIGRQAIDRMELPMKLVDVEWQFDRKKVTFYFTAEHRVDFRALVRELAKRFRTRVELRQIGARDEAARIGGIGSCGRELCCTTWLQEFTPVSTQAARAQNLPLNPVRLSGQCGRLKCCLNYELEQYMDALRHFPSVGSAVELPEGRAVVHKIDIFRERVLLAMPGGDREERGVDAVRALMGLAEGEAASEPSFEREDRRRRRR